MIQEYRYSYNVLYGDKRGLEFWISNFEFSNDDN